ncbi:MAG: UTP--glucose-phosphate uridylyltransferase [Cyanobacteria bacterium RYN_339]|nr:UTP--glucose-phosphate uridylyltransferase [Cyanobacteria bacterium RYN_339]
MPNQAIEELFSTLAGRYQSGDLTKAKNVLSGVVEAPQAGEIVPLPAPGTPAHAALVALGRQALDAGQLGVVILSGGMATRFNYDKPKGVFPIFEGKSFLQLKLEAVKALGRPVPIYLMTSFATDGAIREHLEANQYFGLDPKLVVRFQQYRMPRLAPDGSHFKEDGEVSYAAPGHGDFPMAFQASGSLAAFMEGGGRYLLFSNVDNLGATVDLAIVGSHVQAGKQMTVEVAPKNQGDQGGAPARVDGRLQLVEGFAFPPGFDQDSVDVFNTANYVFNAAALGDDFELPWYVVEKKVDGQIVIQFEHLAGDLSTVLSAHFVRVDREERFLPVKNVTDVPGVQEILGRRWPAKLAALH